MKVPEFDKHLKKGRRTYRPKRCGNNNKDEDNSPKNLNDKNQQASSYKFRQPEIMYFKQESDIVTLNNKAMKLLDHFTYLPIELSILPKAISHRGKSVTAFRRVIY